jgi:hypothetical protein
MGWPVIERGDTYTTMPVDYRDYPADWREIADRIKAAVDYRCQTCGMQCRRPGEPFDTHRRTMSVAHYPDPDPRNVAPENLHALCSGCHLRLDAPLHARRSKYGRLCDETHQQDLFRAL